MAYEYDQRKREAFLAGVHIGIVSIPQDGRGPLTVPLWYRYQPGGDVEFETSRGSRKGRLLDSPAPPGALVGVRFF